LKQFLIDQEFAREKTDEDRCVLGELVFFESQTNRILNLNESEMFKDGTSKLSGGRPVTRLSSSDIALPKGVIISDESGYSVTFVGDSTLAGWTILSHLQAKSEE